jgi:hypothetical protein
MNKAKIYEFPDEYIEQQGYFNFLTVDQNDAFDLICWYINPVSGLLVGVYVPHGGVPLFTWRAWRIKGEDLSLDDHGEFRDMDQFCRDFGAAHISGVTRFMPYVLGIAEHEGAKPEGKVIAFPGCMVPSWVNMKKEECSHEIWKEKRAQDEKENRAYCERIDKLKALGLPYRLCRPLAFLGAYDVDSIAALDLESIRKQRNVGPKAMMELSTYLAKHRVTLREG